MKVTTFTMTGQLNWNQDIDSLTLKKSEDPVGFPQASLNL